MYAPPRPRSRASSPLPYNTVGMPAAPFGFPVTAPFIPPPSAIAAATGYTASSSPPSDSGISAYGASGSYNRSRPSSSNEFRVEKVGGNRSPNIGARGTPLPPSSEHAYFDETTYKQRVAALLSAKDRQFAVTGRAVIDPSQLVLFFRSKSGITQSLDFPIDIDYNPPPALDVLVATCRPHQISDYNNYMDKESLFYPPNLPLTISTDILSSYPILDAVRNALFPNLPPGHYLTAMKDKFEIVLDGGRLERQSAHLRNDGRSATVLVTLPVRFSGGALVVREGMSGTVERFATKTPTRPGESNEVEWVAFLANCDYETEVVDKGYRVMISYGIYLRNLQAEGAIKFQNLYTPPDTFFDFLSPVMNLTRGRTIGVYLSCDYSDVNPSLVTADSLVHQLKAGDYLLYHAFKMYKLKPELHWTAGEYIWPSSERVEFSGDDIISSQHQSTMSARGAFPHPPHRPHPVSIPTPYGPNPMGSYTPHAPTGQGDQDKDALRLKVEESGGQLLTEANITILKDEWTHASGEPGAVERVPFISRGELKKFVVNVLLVVYIP